MSGCHTSNRLRTLILSNQEPQWLLNHPRRRYVRQYALSVVPWADRKVLREMGRRAKARGLVLDHIIPLCHPDVCGLTVPLNMQAIGAGPNAAKGNKWHPDQLDAWGDEMHPWQLQLVF